MANKVLLKKSSVPAKVPQSTDLDYGELALNYNDGALYYKTSANDINPLVAPDLIYNKTTTTLSSTSPTAVDSWSSTAYRTAKYIVQITQGSAYQSSEILVMHDGTTTYNTEYAVLQSDGVLATLSTDLNSGAVRLILTMAGASSATINIKRTLTEV
mgnify:CR=1 FL=1